MNYMSKYATFTNIGFCAPFFFHARQLIVFNIRYLSDASIATKTADASENTSILPTNSDSISSDHIDTYVQSSIDCNCSGLKREHYRKYHGLPPTEEYRNRYVNKLFRQRRLWASYGSKSGLSPAICWPLKEEWEDMLELESLTTPLNLNELIDAAQSTRMAKESEIQAKMTKIDENMKNLHRWKSEIMQRKAKKEMELDEIKINKQDMMEEIREHFGFKVDSKDERFQQMMEMKEQEIKKKQSEMKKQEKRRRLLAKLQKMADEHVESANDNNRTQVSG